MTLKPFWPDRSPAFLKIRRAIRSFPGDPAIGLSGGADSLALVAAACAEGRDVLAICVDHGLQPESADVAAAAVRHAQAMGAASKSIAVTVPAGNLEAQAREARYSALRAEAGTRPLWVAHTMDDQAETYLLGSLRGRAIGMAEYSHVVRPLLRVRRADTQAACAELGLSPWEDPMNSDPNFKRVRIRHELLPLLADIHGGDPVPALAAAAALARDDAAVLNAMPTSRNCAELAAMHIALRRRSYIALLRSGGCDAGARQLRAIDALVMNWHGQGAVAVEGGQVLRIAGELEVRARAE